MGERKEALHGNMCRIPQDDVEAIGQASAHICLEWRVLTARHGKKVVIMVRYRTKGYCM